jgi:phosphoribosylformylglycinamidine (FGAM) synthase-like amidotransferase family enzyme
LKRELVAKTAQLERQAQELASKDQQLAEKDKTIAAQAVSLRYMGAPQSVERNMTDINGRLDKIGQIARETQAIMDMLSTEDSEQVR